MSLNLSPSAARHQAIEQIIRERIHKEIQEASQKIAEEAAEKMRQEVTRIATSVPWDVTRFYTCDYGEQLNITIKVL